MENNLQEPLPFSATRREFWCALASFPLARLYVAFFEHYSFFMWEDFHWGFPAFALGFVLLAEALCWGRARPRESWLWLVCMVCCLGGWSLERSGVWDTLESFFFAHVFAVWWAVSRAGCLLEEVSGHLIPLDMLRGAFWYPMSGLFLRIRTLWHGISRAEGLRKLNRSALFFGLLAVAAAGLLFALAYSLLTRADAAFAALWQLPEVSLWFLEDEIFPFLVSLPVGAYIYGLLSSIAREEPAEVRASAGRVNAGLSSLNRVPAGVWTGLALLFCLFYGVFFGVQFRYLFGAFVRRLPEGFIVSQYAREGFFELCQVMAVNFALLWLLRRTAARETRALLAVSGVLLAESALFAVVALSKLLLYIDCFGFTPLRLRALWLILVLLGGTAAWAYSLFRKKPAFPLWCRASALTLAALCLV